MTIKAITKSFEEIINLVYAKQMHEAFALLETQIKANMLAEHQSQFEILKMTYDNILKFTITGSTDPERTKVYNKLMASTLELTDKVYQYTIQSNSYFPLYKDKIDLQQKDRLTTESGTKLIDLLTVDIELSELLKNSSVESIENAKENSTLLSVFRRLWLTDKYTETEKYFVTELMKSEHFPAHDKCLLVTAVSLSLLNYFDKEKFLLLSAIYQMGEEQVCQRALVGFILSLFKFDKRLSLYPEIEKEFLVLNKQDNFKEDLELVLMQLIKSKDTERLSKKLKDEILPEVMKLAPKLNDKLDIENMLSDAADEDKNPDWKEFFKDTPKLYQKIEEFSNMQLEGSDVFMSTFAMLKRFPFFNAITNWLIPFYVEQQSVSEIFKKEDFGSLKSEFLEAITAAPYMCNSDKYSFCLNFQHIPEAQKGMMMEMFVAEMRQITELGKEDEALNKSAHIRSIYTQYIQDLYRFFKLFPDKDQFHDIFNEELNYSNTCFSQKLNDDAELYRKLAEHYFQKEHFKQALDIYNKLETKGLSETELFQKTAYCYQKLELYDLALAYYEKADLSSSQNVWNLKKIALCHRYLYNHEKALEYYHEAAKLEKDNLYIWANIGHSYLDLKEYEKALEYYFKVEYLAPNNHKVLRPIAWISFILGKYEDAQTYYDKMPETELTKFDLINIGHLYWCLGDRNKASQFYIKSIKDKDLGLELFEKTYQDDQQLMAEHGIDTEEFPLMLDYIKAQLS
ncbi:MAG: hypothetical protein ISR55_02135 [Bacteroidetes bacterium]|nr:hypothetical protein [Bacteroidota bacterium]